MTWLTWRQLRTQTTAVALLVGALSLALLSTVSHLHRIAGSTSAYNLMSAFEHRAFYVGIAVLAVAPALIGAFWGAPLVAREVENGTHRLVWSQSVTRGRWFAVKLGSTVVIAAVCVGALSALVTWWAGPVEGVQSRQRGSLPLRLTPISFGMRGLVPVAYAVLAVATGALLGLALRRTLPAMALTVGLMVLVQVGLPLWVRPHLAPQVTASVTIARDTLDGISILGPGQDIHLTVRPVHKGDWVLRNVTVDSSGRATALPSWTDACFAPPSPLAGRAQGPDITGCLDRLTAEGYRQQVTYQPADRFWRLQWTEAGLVLAGAGLLSLLGFRLLRRVS